MPKYIVGIGAEGIILERHEIEAKDQTAAYYAAMKYMHPDKGYSYISVTRIYKSRTHSPSAKRKF